MVNRPLKIPLSLVLRMFMEQLTTTPQKTAIYDRALIRLQSLKDEAQEEESFTTIGYASIYGLAKLIDKKRLFSYLARKGLEDAKKNVTIFEEKIFLTQTYANVS